MSRALYDGLVEGRGCPYLAFLSVSPGMFEAVDRLQEKKNCPIPQMSILYDKVEEIMIAKFMIGVAHHVCGGLFEHRLVEMFGAGLLTRFLVSSRSGRRGISTRRSKEPDLSIIPTSRNVFFDWPSIVVEVGDSESLSCLQGDLSYWLRNTNGTTRVAILLHINKINGTILIERWEAVPRVRLGKATANYDPTVKRAQRILLDAHVVYNRDPLSIPADQVFDNVPANVGPGQFTLTAQDLDRFNNEYWALSNVVPR